MTTEILRTENVCKQFGGLRAVNGFSFHLAGGEIVGLIGPNGAGKTTVINLLSGAFPPSEGQIILDGKDITGAKAPAVNRLGIARTFQVVRVFRKLTALENVLAALTDRRHHGPWGLALAALGTGYTGLGGGGRREEAEALLETVGILPWQDERAENLPFALAKRLEIARALATKPRILLLDEPSSGLNPSELNGQIDLIRQINARGTTILIIEHVMKVIMGLSHRLVVLHHGEIIAQGDPETVYTDPAVVEAYLGGDSHARH